MNSTLIKDAMGSPLSPQPKQLFLLRGIPAKALWGLLVFYHYLGIFT